MRFRGTVKLAGKTATGIQVPPEVVAELGSGKRPPVRVSINGHTYRSSVAPIGGAFMLPVSAEQRAATGVAAGDEVDIDIEVDTQPREVSVPQDLGDALDGDPQAGRSSTACPTATGSAMCSRSRARRPHRPGSAGSSRWWGRCTRAARDVPGAGSGAAERQFRGASC